MATIMNMQGQILIPTPTTPRTEAAAEACSLMHDSVGNVVGFDVGPLVELCAALERELAEQSAMREHAQQAALHAQQECLKAQDATLHAQAGERDALIKLADLAKLADTMQCHAANSCEPKL